MAVRALQGLIVCLLIVAGFEIGYLSRPPIPEPRVVFSQAAPIESASVPLCAPAEPTTVIAAQPPPPPRRRARNRRETSGQIPDRRSVADCAQNGGPLCGMPE